MFVAKREKSTASAAFTFLEVVYFGVVRSLRRNDGNAIIGLAKSVAQTIVMVMVFYVMLSLMGMRGMAVRGDYFLYLPSGVFLFMTHVKASGAIFMSEGPTSPMMQHAPMNTLVAILSAALASLYTQFLAGFVLLFGYHAAWAPVVIDDPVGMVLMVLLAWYTGIGTGLILLAIKPWYPGLASTMNNIYTRINLFASGKMVVANSLPFMMLPFFTWNPLFHIIDQARGYIFINYNPHFTNSAYAFYIGTGLIMIGMIGEGYTRRHASLSWFARR
jgi:ABC-type polysaccharide/polyol phosphate export permease